MFHYSEVLFRMKNVRILRRENEENCRSGKLTFVSDIRNGLCLPVTVILGFFSNISYLYRGGEGEGQGQGQGQVLSQFP